MKLFIQFEDAPIAMPYGLCEIGQISAMTIQAPVAIKMSADYSECISHQLDHSQGPQLYPKKTTKSQTMETAAHPAALCDSQASWFLATIMAMIM